MRCSPSRSILFRWGPAEAARAVPYPRSARGMILLIEPVPARGIPYSYTQSPFAQPAISRISKKARLIISNDTMMIAVTRSRRPGELHMHQTALNSQAATNITSTVGDWPMLKLKTSTNTMHAHGATTRECKLLTQVPPSIAASFCS